MASSSATARKTIHWIGVLLLTSGSTASTAAISTASRSTNDLVGRLLRQYDDPNIAKNVPESGSGPGPAPAPASSPDGERTGNSGRRRRLQDDDESLTAAPAPGPATGAPSDIGEGAVDKGLGRRHLLQRGGPGPMWLHVGPEAGQPLSTPAQASVTGEAAPAAVGIGPTRLRNSQGGGDIIGNSMTSRKLLQSDFSDARLTPDVPAPPPGSPPAPAPGPPPPPPPRTSRARTIAGPVRLGGRRG